VSMASMSNYDTAMSVLGGALTSSNSASATATSTGPTTTITSPDDSALVTPGVPLNVSGVSTFPPSAFPATGAGTTFYVRRDDCGGTNDNPHLSRQNDTGGTDPGNGCGLVFQALAPTGVADFSTTYPVGSADLPLVLGSGKNVTGQIMINATGVSPDHTITVDLVSGTTVLGTQTVTAAAVGAPVVAEDATPFPFSFPVADDFVGKQLTSLALVVHNDVSTAVEAGTQTTDSYVNLPTVPSSVPAGSSVQVSLDDAAFAHPTTVQLAPDGSWSGSLATGSLAAGTHTVRARTLLGTTAGAADSRNVVVGAPTGPGLVQVQLVRKVATASTTGWTSARDLTGTGTMSSWDASINVSKLANGDYLLMTRVVRSGAVVATATPISVKLHH
jgi:hypothetical protein